MPEMPPLFGSRGRREANRQSDRARGTAHARGYDARWAKASDLHRKQHPFCQYCEAGAFGPARVSAADCTDHLYPHRGDPLLFWRAEWWVSACNDCHNGPKQVAEHAGRVALDRLARLLGRPTLGG
jgi:5-methylcytosine-specific restriction protein A